MAQDNDVLGRPANRFDPREIMILTPTQALNALARAWPTIVAECRQVLGSELHYQAMIYHALRMTSIQAQQLGMNVRQRIPEPSTCHFQGQVIVRGPCLTVAETIPDIVIFHPLVNGDWRGRNCTETLRHMLLIAEVKVSERDGGRLGYSEIARDIRKLIDSRREVVRFNARPETAMIIVDTAPSEKERMLLSGIDAVMTLCREHNVSFFYMNSETATHVLLNCC
ncbi:hypothetical protein [Azospirillum canadense]|uniref:hypothetical protein n=1 Tax=Azospirillum canadense TaxID=403962 RepID=UPI002227DF46|nr:hypothetical protein [Azospirillum canadense]MCW2240761.1 hypothetical protein [Azospirillum canadense]